MSTASPTDGRLIVRWIREFDQILRGDTTSAREIYRTDPKHPDIKIQVGGISVMIGLLGAGYGFCMATFALVGGAESSQYMQAYMQTLASMTKVPLLFLLTIFVTFPSLYVFNALVGSQLKFGPVFRLLVSSLAVNLAVLASLGPIVAFFSVSTPNYGFIVLLNVFVFAIAGFLGLAYMVQALKRLTQCSGTAVIRAELMQEAQNVPSAESVSGDVGQAGPVERASATSRSRPMLVAGSTPTERFVTGRQARNVLAIWLIAFGLVGAQMGWVLRPFIGSPGLPFQWFRPRHSNFFSAVWDTLQNLLS